MKTKPQGNEAGDARLSAHEVAPVIGSGGHGVGAFHGKRYETGVFSRTDYGEHGIAVGGDEIEVRGWWRSPQLRSQCRPDPLV